MVGVRSLQFQLLHLNDPLSAGLLLTLGRPLGQETGLVFALTSSCKLPLPLGHGCSLGLGLLVAVKKDRPGGLKHV